jgi:hypothetical protein
MSMAQRIRNALAGELIIKLKKVWINKINERTIFTCS